MPFPSMKYIGMIFQGSKVFTLLEMTLALGWNSQHKRYCVARVLRVATSSLVLHVSVHLKLTCTVGKGSAMTKLFHSSCYFLVFSILVL